MKYLNLQQGTREWLTHRASAFNASEAPAMLGLSPYTSRQALLREKHTGIVPEITDAGTLARFARGHEAEAQLRPLIEQQIGDELYPVVGMIEQDGMVLSASFDGLTMDETTAFEHKLWNQSLADFLTEHNDLPETHWPQVEHQILVSGCESVLFSVSDGTLEQHVGIRYQSQSERRERVLKGWAQFAKDLAKYVPAEVIEKPKGAAVLDLPAVMVKVSGQIAITDNLDKFSSALKSFVETQLIREPKTDQDFADLESQVKTLKKAEEALDSAEAHMLAQVDSVDTATRTIDMLRKIARDNRLMAEKLVKTEKENIKTAAIMNARKLFMDHISALNAEIRPVQIEGVTPDFNGSAKNKRTMASLHDAIDTELARVKIESDAQAKGIRLNLALLKEHGKGYEFLFNDLATIAHKPTDDFAALVAHRVSEHKAAEQARIAAERQQIEAEAKAKAEREAAQRMAEEEARIRAEERAKAEAQQRADQQAAMQAQEKIRANQREYAAAHAPIHEQIPEKTATETVLVIRHKFTDGFIKKAVADSLSKYGIEVESVDAAIDAMREGVSNGA